MSRHDDSCSGLGVVFQPISDATTGAVVAYEALGRAATGAGYGPAELLDMAVCAGALVDLDRWWRKLAIEQVALHQRDTSAVFHLNIDARIVDEPMWRPGFLRAQLAEHDLPASRFVLELTERSASLDSELLEALLPVYRELGFRIAIGDVGVGRATLGTVVRHKPDVVKLDRALIGGVDADPTRRQLIASLVEFCGRDGITLVAEGVERAEELAVLRGLGVGRVQGWFVGEPRPLAAAVRSEPAPAEPTPPLATAARSGEPARPARSSLH